MLTEAKLKAMESGDLIATGIVLNNPDGIFMTNDRLNDELRWVAVRGGYHDWAIYIQWADRDVEYVRKSGDKVRGKENIQKLVPCDEEALNLYRN